MNSKTFTVDDVMSFEPCYTRERVEQLWAGRESLTYDEIMELDISHNDIVWFLTKSGFTGSFKDPYGSKYWYKNGKLHRENDLPSIERSGGTREWLINGIRHRDNGPAIERSYGRTVWYKDGRIHREDGPAIEYSNGTKYWYKDDELHRDDGPAVEYWNGSKEWWVNGESIRHED